MKSFSGKSIVFFFWKINSCIAVVFFLGEHAVLLENQASCSRLWAYLNDLNGLKRSRLTMATLLCSSVRPNLRTPELVIKQSTGLSLPGKLECVTPLFSYGVLGCLHGVDSM